MFFYWYEKKRHLWSLLTKDIHADDVVTADLHTVDQQRKYSKMKKRDVKFELNQEGRLLKDGPEEMLIRRANGEDIYWMDQGE